MAHEQTLLEASKHLLGHGIMCNTDTNTKRDNFLKKVGHMGTYVPTFESMCVPM